MTEGAEMDVKETGIENIGLSVRAQNALRQQNVTTVGQLLECTEERLFHIRNLGVKTVGEILKKIEEYQAYADRNELPSPPDDLQQVHPDIADLFKGTEFSEIEIDKIGLSVRAVHALHRDGVFVVEQLLGYTEEKLLLLHNIGVKTVTEIMDKIAECQAYAAKGSHEPELPQTPEELFALSEGKEFAEKYLQDKGVRIDCLTHLPARAYNLLTLHGYSMLHQVIFTDLEGLLAISRMDPGSASDIRLLCDQYLQENGESILKAFILEKKRVTIFDMLSMPEHIGAIKRYVKENDKPVDLLGLSVRPTNQLSRHGLHFLSDILLLTKADLLSIQAMGSNSVEEILQFQHDYLSANEQRLIAYCTGDESALLDDLSIRTRILELFNKTDFAGLNLAEMLAQLKLPDGIAVERVKKIIGGLLADNLLEYVDFRCYRVFPHFRDALLQCPKIDDRNRRILQKRMDGETLEAIAQLEGGLTRERVRQIIIKAVAKVTAWHTYQTGLKYFDEDYYRYFFSTYSIDRESAITWLGIPPEVFCYLDMQDVKRGKQPVDEALSDPKIDAGLRLKIKNYTNRDRLFIDGIWVTKKRTALEEVVARKFCQESVTFSDFIELYNGFLRQYEIPFDDKLYYTPEVIPTRKNRLSDARFILWSQGEMLRYYDIDSLDYSELFDALGLEGYENIEISTLKLMDLHPDLMAKYSIHDHYELHNLLKKVVSTEQFPTLKMGRMPMLSFGEADRSAQLLELVIEHSPCSLDELFQYAKEAYGFETGAVTWSSIIDYYHAGVFSVDQKVMHFERREMLQKHLTDDFYFLDEIRAIYGRLFPDGDLDEINHYNLRQMGFLVRSQYAVQHYPSLDAFFTHMLTSEDIVDIRYSRKRFTYIQSFSQALTNLKRDRQIIEYEPNQFLSLRRLENSGITIEGLQDFCDAVWDFVPEGSFFSARSIREDGFTSDLYDLGFSDWFYASLLGSDSRFSFCTCFGCIILYKGKAIVSIKAFETCLVQKAVQIDAYDLQTEMEDHYGCVIKDKSDLIYKVQGTEIYYDRILDRFYANEDAFERDLDRAEGL